MTANKCGVCEGQVAEHAETCPLCGAPVGSLKRRSKAALMELLVNAVVIALVCIGFLAMVRRLMS
jgi:hypothetical protein